MSTYLIESLEDFNFDNILFGSEVTNKIYIYYLDKKPKEILLNFPNVRLIYNYKNIKYNQIKVPIYPLWEKTNIFIKFIKKLEKFIQQKIKINKNYSNCLEKKEYISVLKINIDENIKDKLNNLLINSEIEGVIGLSYIWIKEETWGLALNFKTFNYINKTGEVDFIDNNDIILKQNNKINNNTPQQISFNHNKVMNISSNLLQDAMKKLKKI